MVPLSLENQGDTPVIPSIMELSTHDRTVEEVRKLFNVDENGLSDNQIEENRKRYGPNGKTVTCLFAHVI